MEIVYKEGNLLDSQAQVIGHQVNAMATMGSGVAKYVREKYPKAWEDYKNLSPEKIFGKCQIVRVEDGKYIANLGGQYYYSGYHGIDWKSNNAPDNGRCTNYEALYRSLEELHDAIKRTDGNINSIAFPYFLGCGRGGGDWDIVLVMITKIFSDLPGTIEIWKL